MDNLEGRWQRPYLSRFPTLRHSDSLRVAHPTIPAGGITGHMRLMSQPSCAVCVNSSPTRAGCSHPMSSICRSRGNPPPPSRLTWRLSASSTTRWSGQNAACPPTMSWRWNWSANGSVGWIVPGAPESFTAFWQPAWRTAMKTLLPLPA